MSPRQPNGVESESSDYAVQLDDVRLWTPQGKQILQGIDWRVRTGERWTLLGPNGSGKSTILALAGAVRHPSSGFVTVLGRRLGKVDMPSLRKRIGVVDSGAAILGWLTAEDIVLTGASGTTRPLWGTYSPQQHERARAMLALFACEHLADREIATCSQGERGRVRIARALMADPALLLLDEPAVGLDLTAREALIAALDRLSEERPELTSVLVTHHLEEIPRTTTHALLVRDGRVVASGPITDAITSEAMSACFGFPIECRREGDRWSARAPATWTG